MKKLFFLLLTATMLITFGQGTKKSVRNFPLKSAEYDDSIPALNDGTDNLITVNGIKNYVVQFINAMDTMFVRNDSLFGRKNSVVFYSGLQQTTYSGPSDTSLWKLRSSGVTLIPKTSWDTAIITGSVIFLQPTSKLKFSALTVSAIANASYVYGRNSSGDVVQINQTDFSTSDSLRYNVNYLLNLIDSVVPYQGNGDTTNIPNYIVINSLNAPAVTTNVGDAYLVGNSPSGLWVGHAKDIAEWNGSAWVFTDGVQGDFLYNATTALTYIFRNGNWVQTAGIPILNKGNTISTGVEIGTKNNKSLAFKTNNVPRGRIDSLGNWHINATLDDTLGIKILGLKGDKIVKVDNAFSSGSSVSAGNGVTKRNDTISIGGRITDPVVFTNSTDTLISIDSIGRFHVYNLPTAGSADTFVNVSNTSGQLSKVGKSTFLNGIGGGGGQIAFTKTKAEIDTLIAGGDLVSGALYEITGVHPTLYDDGTTSGTTIYLRAISGNQLEMQGMGKFFNPKYNKSVDGFGIWDNKMYGTLSNVVGNFDYKNKESVTANNSATGLILSDGMIQWVSGDWSAALSITGSVSGATADITGFVTPTYSIGDKVIWGGYSWTNVNGNVGTSTDVLNLDGTNWSKNVYDTTNYNLAYDLIEYDYANDMIIRRHDLISNIDVRFDKGAADLFTNYYSIAFNAISVQQFGNPFNLVVEKGVSNKLINNGYDESINFCGSLQYNLTFGSGSLQSNLTFGNNSYQYNLTFGQESSQQNLIFGTSSSQQNLTFGQNSYQYNLTFGQNSYQYNLTFGTSSNQYNLTFGQNSNQNNLTFGQNSSQSNLIFGTRSSQYNLTFGNNSFQSNLIFGSGSAQSNLTFGDGSYQQSLTFGSGSHQITLTFGDGSRLNYNSQVISSNMEYINFNTKDVIVPDLSAATLLFDSNIKEVYQRPDGTIKLKFMNNSDVLEVHGIAD